MHFKSFGAMGATFATLGRQGLGILHVAWLPALLQYAAYMLLMPGFLKATTMLTADPPADAAETWQRLSPTLPMMILFVVLALGLSIIMTAGLARLLLRGERPKLPFLLVWGRDETRILTCWGIIIATGIGVAAAFGLFQMLASFLLSGNPIATMLMLCGLLLIVLAGVWIAVRLSLFTPATVAEERLGVSTSYELTEDIFWPLLGFWVMWVVLVILVQLVVVNNLVTPPGVREAMQGANFTSRDAFRDAMSKMYEALANGYDLSDSGNIVRQTITFAFNMITGVVFGVASIVAWKSLKDDAEAEAA
jgi:hypothetical protein